MGNKKKIRNRSRKKKESEPLSQFHCILPKFNQILWFHLKLPTKLRGWKAIPAAEMMLSYYVRLYKWNTNCFTLISKRILVVVTLKSPRKPPLLGLLLFFPLMVSLSSLISLITTLIPINMMFVARNFSLILRYYYSSSRHKFITWIILFFVDWLIGGNMVFVFRFFTLILGRTAGAAFWRLILFPFFVCYYFFYLHMFLTWVNAHFKTWITLVSWNLYSMTPSFCFFLLP